jgi:hypothetical protein
MWQRILPRMRDLQIYASKKVVRSMRPLVSFLHTFTKRLPLCSLGGDVTDAGFMQLVATVTCMECHQEREGDQLTVQRCAACVASDTLPQLRGLQEIKVRYEEGERGQ